jgi:uncharacterized protein YkwD
VTPASVIAAATTSIKQTFASSSAKTKKPLAVATSTPAQNSTPSTTAPASAPTSSPDSSTSSSATTSAQEPLATTSAPSQNELLTQEIEIGIHQKINDERAKAGLPALALNAELAALARSHSEDMLDNSYFAHDDAGGCSSSCRLTEAGFPWSASGENIYMMSGYAIAVDKAVQMTIEGWMDSPGHRANILNSSFTEEGIGVAFVGTKLYATEDFALPR